MQQAGERLSRFLAHAGIASRRHAEELIAAGRVQVNGQVISTQGTRIDPAHDQVRVDGKLVQAALRLVYVLLHKPVGYVTTVHDPEGRPAVLELLPAELRRLRVYPVGRLDRETSGLLLLTNDGDFALHLSHPRYALEKHYHALVQGYPSEVTLAMLRKGVEITEDDGRSHVTAPAQVSVLRLVSRGVSLPPPWGLRPGSLPPPWELASALGANCWVALTIHEGRKRQVRRMLAVVGHPVLELIRVGIGPITLDGVPVGKWRYLTEEEVRMLMI